jgi:hypothetical protein
MGERIEALERLSKQKEAASKAKADAERKLQVGDEIALQHARHVERGGCVAVL